MPGGRPRKPEAFAGDAPFNVERRGTNFAKVLCHRRSVELTVVRGLKYDHVCTLFENQTRGARIQLKTMTVDLDFSGDLDDYPVHFQSKEETFEELVFEQVDFVLLQILINPRHMSSY